MDEEERLAFFWDTGGESDDFREAFILGHRDSIVARATDIWSFRSRR
jgi:hypothetical protein